MARRRRPPSPLEELKKLERLASGSTTEKVAAAETGKVTRASRALAGFRWIYMPIGLFALIAVGVHAAADAIDDRILWGVDQVDAVFDGIVGRWKLTAGAVDWIGFEQRVTFARALTLIWELAVDLILAIPALGYFERTAPSPMELVRHRHHQTERTGPYLALLKRVQEVPTALRILRPLATAAVVVAGATAVARMVQGALYLWLHGIAGDGVAGFTARMAALAALAAVLYGLGWRAVLRNLEHADEVSSEGRMTIRRALTEGWVATAVVLPVAFAAAFDASPIASFFR